MSLLLAVAGSVLGVRCVAHRFCHLASIGSHACPAVALPLALVLKAANPRRGRSSAL